MNDDMRKVLEGFWKKVAEGSKAVPFISDAIALYRFMCDPCNHWIEKTVVAAALAYFIMPLDAIPDTIPVAGYLDDAGVIAAARAYVGYKLSEYY